MAIAFVWGTRPEAIKLGPIVAELRELRITPLLICTGQHTDLLRGTPAESDLKDSISLGLTTSGDHESWTDVAHPLIAKVLRLHQARCVVVQGDTMSVLAGALAGHAMGLPVIHVEAGIRSGTLREPYPEEPIRRWVTALVKETGGFHLCPGPIQMRNLHKEGIDPRSTILTGNPVVSAMARYTRAVPVRDPSHTVLITMHRREWLSQGAEHVWATIRALESVAEEHPSVSFVWPMHPVVWRMGLEVDQRPDPGPSNVFYMDPLPYKDAVETLAGCLGVATDSGGLQEEAGTLGVPCAVLRNVTDRPESVVWGTAKLYDPSPLGITKGLQALIRRELPRDPANLYGEPDAAKKIAKFLASFGKISGN